MGRTPVCDHCAPGYHCDPTTGACIRGTFKLHTNLTQKLTLIYLQFWMFNKILLIFKQKL